MNCGKVQYKNNYVFNVYYFMYDCNILVVHSFLNLFLA